MKMFARPLINKIILSPWPLLYKDDLSHTGIIVKLTTKPFLVAPGPGQKSQAQPETSPVAREVAGTAHQLNPTLPLHHRKITGIGGGEKGISKNHEGIFMSCLAKGTAVFPKKGTLYLCHHLCPIKSCCYFG